MKLFKYFSLLLSCICCMSSLNALSSNGSMDRAGLSRTGTYPTISLNSLTGVLWEKNYHTIFATPAVTNEYVYLYGTDQRISCVARVDGSLVWERSLEANFTNTTNAAIAVDEESNLAIFGINAPTKQLIAYDAASGVTRWEFQTKGPILNSPVIDNGITYVTDAQGYAYAVNNDSGRRIWSTRVGRGASNAIAINRPYLYVATGSGEVVALRLIDGSELWRVSNFKEIIGTVAVSEGQVFICDILNKSLVALDAGTGEENWHYSIAMTSSTSPTVAGELVYLPDASGTAHAIHAETGTLVWRVKLPQHATAPFTAAGNVLYIPTYGKLLALDRLKGSILWEFACPNKIKSQCVVSNGELFVLDNSGTCYALH